MSENVKHAHTTIVIPYVNIDRVIELLIRMYKNSAKEMKLTELAMLLGCSVSNLNNVTPTIDVLRLGDVKKGTLTLSPDGLIFADYCIHEDYEKAKQVIKKNIQNSEALMFTKSLLETRSSLSGDEIGRALSERFGKNWKDIRTTRNFGNSCASIISFAGLGYFSDGVLSLKSPTIKASSTFYPPTIGYNPILEILNALHGFDRAKTEDIAEKLQTNSYTLSSSLTVCTILGLTERETANTFILTESGRQLIDPTVSQETKTAVFRKCLLNSQYESIIQKLGQSNKEMTFAEIGDVIAFLMKARWSDDTKLAFAKKFLTWLNNAELAEKVKPGLYKFKIDVSYKKEHEEINKEPKVEQPKVDINSIYEIGRSIGNLESIILEKDKTSFFNEQLVFLKELLSKHEDLKLTLDMLANSFETAKNTNNPAVYQSNINFVRNKIKEKLMGVN